MQSRPPVRLLSDLALEVTAYDPPVIAQWREAAVAKPVTRLAHTPNSPPPGRFSRGAVFNDAILRSRISAFVVQVRVGHGLEKVDLDRRDGGRALHVQPISVIP